MEDKQVTVVMSAYNHGKYVAKAIESVLNQTFRGVYFVVADDASTDNTVDVLMQYESVIDEIHLYDINSGYGRCKHLIMNAKTKYIAMINSDDYWERTKLEKQVAYMEKHPECAACFTWCNEVTEEGESLDNQIFQVENRTREEWMYRFWEAGNCLAHPSILVRREIYQSLVQKNRDVFRQVPDFWMWMTLVQTQNIHVIQEPLVNFLYHKSSISENVSAPSFENIIRDQMEESFLWYKIIKEMDDDYFVRTFSDVMVNPYAGTHEEIMCEKYFILCISPLETVQGAAINYYYDVFGDIKLYGILQEKYGYSNREFHQIEMKIGMGAKLKKVSEDSMKALQTAREALNLLKITKGEGKI